MRETLRAGLFLLAAGCGGAAGTAGGPARQPSSPAPAASEAPPPIVSAPPGGAWELPARPRDAALASPKEAGSVSLDGWARASKAKGVGPSSPSCADFGRPATTSPAAGGVTDALAEKDAGKRNVLLFAHEAKLGRDGKTEGVETIRAIRAELVPTECADAITDPSLSKAQRVSGLSGQMLVGTSLASKLSRTALHAPTMADTSDKEKVRRFIQGPLRQWMVEQASAIDALSAPAAELVGLARGVVAIEAGMADLRLVDRIRSSPTPRSWDKELKGIYEAVLDEALEPRKTRGRDAALVGLADFASSGILYDARIDRARTLLSKLYGGRRIDALDALLLPPLAPPASPIPETVLLVAAADRSNRDALGLLAPTSASAHGGRARLEMGRKYWRRVDFVEAAHAAAKEEGTESRIVLAVALALAKGPSGAKEMMAASSPSALGLTSTAALDELAADPKDAGAAGRAAFDAAHLRSLSPPEGAAAGPFFVDLAARFRRAASLLEDAGQKKMAEERAVDADAAAKAAGGRAG